jgi:hypothetical protein
MVSNTCTLSLPKSLDAGDSRSRLIALLRALVVAWEPDWGGVISSKSLDVRNVSVGSIYVDWILYMNRLDVDRSMLPDSATAYLVENLGTIIVTQDQPIDPTNAQDLQNIKTVTQAVGLGTT